MLLRKNVAGGEKRVSGGKWVPKNQEADGGEKQAARRTQLV